MATRFYGSICITDIFDLVNKKHSAFSKGDNGKIYADVTIWLNDKEDKYGNIMAAQLNPKRDMRESDGQPYIGNFKEAEKKPITSRDTGSFSLPTDLPAREKTTQNSASDITEPIDDLPF